MSVCVCWESADTRSQWSIQTDDVLFHCESHASQADDTGYEGKDAFPIENVSTDTPPSAHPVIRFKGNFGNGAEPFTDAKC